MMKRRSIRKIGNEYMLFVGGSTPYGSKKFKTKKKARAYMQMMK